MAKSRHTPGPHKVEQIGRRPVMKVVAATVYSPADEHLADFRHAADANLFTVASDHALVCWAVCVAAGRWEPSGDGSGELCINSIRYSTKLDAFGCPTVNSSIRAAIEKAGA